MTNAIKTITLILVYVMLEVMNVLIILWICNLCTFSCILIINVTDLILFSNYHTEYQAYFFQCIVYKKKFICFVMFMIICIYLLYICMKSSRFGSYADIIFIFNRQLAFLIFYLCLWKNVNFLGGVR